MRLLFLFKAVSVLFLLCTYPSFASVKAIEQTGPDGKPVIVIETHAMKLTINPEEGGRISGFFWKPTGHQWVLPGDEDGFFLDHVWQESWPGELLHRTYTAKILKAGPEHATVRVSTIIKGNGHQSIEGVRIIRTMTVNDNSPGIDVTIRLENPTNQPRDPGLWVQNIPQVGGTRNALWTFRPSTHGIIRATYETGGGKNDFIYDPTAGWTAIVNPHTEEGVVFLMDYNYLRCLYDNGGSQSVEWWYDQVRLAPGKSFETKIVMWPISGMQAVSYASHTLIGDIEMKVKGHNIVLVNRLVSGPEPVIGNVKVELQLIDYDTGQVLQIKKFSGITISETSVEQRFFISNAPLMKNLVARVTVIMAGNKKQAYETYLAHGGIMGTQTQYHTTRPPRIRPIERPAVIVKTPHKGFRILHLRGVFSYGYKIPDTAKILKAYLKSGSYETFVYGPSLSYFPANYHELMSYDVIVLDNIPIDSIDMQTQQYLSDYVDNGGVLLVIGGNWAFGDGGYKGTKLESILPVTSIGPFDVVKIKKGGITPNPAGKVRIGTFWVQKVKVRPSAHVKIKAGNHPFWVQWQYGKGVAIVLAGLCYGKSTKKMTLFIKWPGWPAWLASQLKLAVKEIK
ncbi:MAG: glutamine amidotransferase [Candidatus Omnitrophica bacterium]|nr:glutamine amidotransferase [Candidatus Omnitrophota bacterium]